jgi:undecaprenyl-diphosphatase
VARQLAFPGWRPRRLLDFFAWVGRHELGTLIVLLLTIAALWAFAELADEVSEGQTHEFDEAVILAMRSAEDSRDPWGPPWLEELMRDATALGGNGVLTLMTLVVIGYLAMVRKTHAAVMVLVAVGGGMLFSSLLKMTYDRPRPELVPHGSIVYSASFPSGHAMISAVTYLTLGALLSRVQPRWRLKAYMIMVAVFITTCVGVSRVYLGVHWPTDVLAGWTAGAAWALICWLAARYLQRRGAVEREGEEPEAPEDLAAGSP